MSKQGINRTVLVGTPIYPDSNASIKDKRPQYFTATAGDRASCLPPGCVCEYDIIAIIHD